MIVPDTPALAHLIQQAESSENPRDRANAEVARRELSVLCNLIKEKDHVAQNPATHEDLTRHPQGRSPAGSSGEQAAAPEVLPHLPAATKQQDHLGPDR